MRTIGTSIVDAINSPAGTKIRPWIVAWKSRVFADAEDLVQTVAFGDYSTTFDETPVPQDAAYNMQIGRIISASTVGTNIRLVLHEPLVNVIAQYSASNILVAANTKPSLYGNFLFYIGSDGSLRKATINPATLSSGSGNCITSIEVITSGATHGAVHALSETEVVRIGYDGFGLTVAYYRKPSSWQQYVWDGRFVFPTALADDPNMCTFTGAAKLGENIFVYATNWSDGSVLGVKINGGFWFSDSFVAIPSDLTKFYIGNVFYANNKIHIVGQFDRTDEYANGVPYNMVVSSDTGYNFSMGLNSVFSDIGRRYVGFIGNGMFHAYCSGRVIRQPVTREFAAPPGYLVVPGDDILSLSASDGNASSTATVVIANGSEQYKDNEYLEDGNIAEIFMNYGGSMLYGTYVIDSKEDIIADGVRRLQINLVQEGVYKLNTGSNPFYVEISGKTSVFDDCKELDNLYVASSPMQPRTRLDLDFWKSTGYDGEPGVTTPLDILANGGVSPYEAGGGHRYGILVGDLVTKHNLNDYPIITGNVETVVWGWSRTDSDVNNDNFQIRLKVEDTDGVQRIVTPSWTQTPPRPARTYVEPYVQGSPYGDRVVSARFDIGSVVYSGEKIIDVIVIVESINPSVFNLERVTLWGGISYAFPTGDGNTPWSIELGDPGIPPAWRGEKYLMTIPGTNRPYIMFSSKPYSANSFVQQATFEYLGAEYGETENLFVAWGFVCFAQDGENYIAVRLNSYSNRFEIVKVVNGAETIVHTSSVMVSLYGVQQIMLLYSDGVFITHVKSASSSTWSPVDTYKWTAADGVLYTGTDGIYRIGIYGLRRAPSFRIPSFDIRDSEAVVPLPGEESGFDLFPNDTGQVMIGENIYEFSGKSIRTETIGPYGARNSNTYGEEVGVEISWFDWQGYHNAPLGPYLASDNGHVWTISRGEFQLEETKNRSRWFGAKFNGNHFGQSNRMYIGPGLVITKKIKGEDDVTHEHGADCSMVPGNVSISEYIASNGDPDATLKDLIRAISSMQGVKTEFPGDNVLLNVPITPSSNIKVR